MCGIAGYYGNGTQTVLEKMQASLLHRGPDAGGVKISGKVGLAHRRLSILDLSSNGAQPMVSDDGRLTLSFNGEIFNFEELRQRYLPEETFKGGSDTEVILKLYQKLGTSAFSKLAGMFAFAIFDSRSDKLFLVRDSLGKKPLYWSQTKSGTLIFGSELKALRQHPECPLELDREAIAAYLVFEYIPAPKTIYRDVYKLAANSYLVFDGTTIVHQQLDSENSVSRSNTTPRANLYSLMEESVSRRLVADVPVGVFLSGGLDSSTVAYFAQRATQNQIKTFSVGFTDPSFDEQDDAKLVADHLGTDHHAVVLGVADIRRIIADLPQILDEPMGDSSIIPTTLVSEFARQHVKVSLSGDGADELFHGYGTFFAHKLATVYKQMPAFLRQGVAFGVNKLPVSHAYMSLDFKLKRFMAGIDMADEYRNAVWLSAFTPSQVHDISDGKLETSTVFTQLDSWYGGSPRFSDGLQAEYLCGYLSEDILVKTDRASMRHGLEVRSPFLDEKIIAYALGLEECHKMRGKTGKYLVKLMMQDHLPTKIVWKAKKGFNIPIGRLICEDMREEFAAAILEGALIKTELFNRSKLEKILQDHWGGAADNRKQIWTLYTLARWLEAWHT